MRADMDGGDQRTLIDTEIIFPVDLAVDYHMGHRLYWSDPKKGVIESTASDGSDRVIVIKHGLWLDTRNIDVELSKNDLGYTIIIFTPIHRIFNFPWHR